MIGVKKLARMFDGYIAVDVGWKKGDIKVKEFEQWIKRYEVDVGSQDLLEILKRAAIAADATSECGGGAAAVYWFDFGRVIVGIPNTTQTIFVIPANAEIPEMVINEDN